SNRAHLSRGDHAVIFRLSVEHRGNPRQGRTAHQGGGLKSDQSEIYILNTVFLLVVLATPAMRRHTFGTRSAKGPPGSYLGMLPPAGGRRPTNKACRVSSRSTGPHSAIAVFHDTFHSNMLVENFQQNIAATSNECAIAQQRQGSVVVEQVDVR